MNNSSSGFKDLNNIFRWGIKLSISELKVRIECNFVLHDPLNWEDLFKVRNASFKC